MKYKSHFTVIYSKRTGKITQEIWEPLQRLFWPLPWVRLSGEPKFGSWKELSSWFKEHYPDKELTYCRYGKSKSEN